MRNNIKLSKSNKNTSYIKKENLNDNYFKKRKKILTVLALSIVLLTGVLSLAFFTTVNDSRNQTMGLQTGTMSLRFADNDNGINAKLAFGGTVTKKFIIENTGTLESSLSLDWLNLVNTYLNRSLSYNLSYSPTEDGEYTIVIPESNVPTSNMPISSSIASELSVPAGETYYYNLNITLNNLPDVEQSSDLDAEFTTQFTVNNPSKYRYYTLRVNPNGGTWNEFTGPQEYPLMNNDEMDIPNPSRYGYNFNSWDIKGISYELENTKFIMGISDTYFTAEWTPKKVKVTIDGVEQTVDFGTTIDLPTPEREGYTFAGWEPTGGTVEGNTLTVDTEEDITITPSYIANKYKYIVYHNQMNVTGEGYTLVSADTDEGDADYNSTITPPVKTYTGFTSPANKSLTIQAEEEYPPVKNRVDYNYDRNKYVLTKNIDGTATTEEVYYGATVDLGIPDKTGYDFTNWTVTGAVLNENAITIGTEAISATANFTPKTYSVIFNANGGTTSTSSKVVIYGEAYGELPIPEYDGYTFLGWYTSQDGGEEITESTNVGDITGLVLYAHWKAESLMVARNNYISSEKMWSQRANITGIVFENTMSPKENATYTYDMSSKENNSVIAYLVPNEDDPTKYTTYIQADGDIIANSNSSYLFRDFTSLKSISGLEYLDTSKVTNMTDMFRDCSSLATLDVSNFNTNNVTEMGSMFDGCSSLTALDLSNFDTGKVIHIGGMFDGCSSLTALDLSNFDTSNVTSMGSMFSNCSSLTTLDLSNFDTSKVTGMASMFSNCSGLTTLDLSNFDTSNVTEMQRMFESCNNLTTLDLSNFDTVNVTNMSFMFQYCSYLITTITIRGTKCTKYEQMFYNSSTAYFDGKIIVNYTEDASSLVDQMISTKSPLSIVRKGNQEQKYTITLNGSSDVSLSSTINYRFDRIRLLPTSSNKMVTSFKMNGTLIQGSTFTMPASDVTITDVTLVEAIIVESEHNPYPIALKNKEYFNKTFEGATSLTVILEYQTGGITSSYIYLYDKDNMQYGKYGGVNTIETVEIPGDTLRITFSTSYFEENCYGFKAAIIPNY